MTAKAGNESHTLADIEIAHEGLSSVSELQSAQNPNHETTGLLPCITALKQLILIHSAAASDALFSKKRTRLAKLVKNLPKGAATVHRLCLNDLPTAAAALGISSLSLACEHAQTGKLVEAVQAADRGIVMLGADEDILKFVEGVEKVMRLEETMPCGEGLESMGDKVLGDEELAELAVPRYLRGECTVVSADDFAIAKFREFFKRDEPVVIRSCAQWNAVKKWREVAYWRRHAHRVVPVELEDANGSMKEAFLPLHEVIGAMLDGRRVYMAQHTLLSQIPLLREDIAEPVYTEIGGGADVMNVWMGSAATGSKLHHDSADNILVQVVGHKTVVLLSPDSPVYAGSSNFSPVDVVNPNYDKFPLFRNSEGLIAELAPGDGLYIPAGYWHYVKARTSSISVNFWF